MRRVDDFRENAQACRDLAEKMAGATREHLLKMAAEWDMFADQRERQIEAGITPGDCPEE